MARTAVAITDLVKDAATAAATNTAIVHASGAVLDAKGNSFGLLIELTNTFAGEKVMTIKAPTDSRAAVRSGVGDLAITFAAGDSTAVVKHVLIESARFAQSDGKIHIDFATDTTGFMRAYRVPRGA